MSFKVLVLVGLVAGSGVTFASVSQKPSTLEKLAELQKKYPGLVQPKKHGLNARDGVRTQLLTVLQEKGDELSRSTEKFWREFDLTSDVKERRANLDQLRTAVAGAKKQVTIDFLEEPLELDRDRNRSRNLRAYADIWTVTVDGEPVAKLFLKIHEKGVWLEVGEEGTGAYFLSESTTMQMTRTTWMDAR